jgi:hypothetical protein
MSYFQTGRAYPGAVVSAAATPASPGVLDLARFITGGVFGPLAQAFGQITSNFSDAMAATSFARAPQTRERKEECGCKEDPCQCTCCIVDADVILYAYAGEQRMIHMVVENHHRREKTVKITLPPFTGRSGNAAPITGTLLPPTEFKLGPCASQPITMIVTTHPGGAIPENIPDVDTCTVYYANLQVEGCEIRPVRIAVAILPRDCGAYRIECRSCCC